MNEFLAMGGYAKFVWPAYVITFVAVFANIYAARRAHRAALEEARRRLSVQGDEQ
jgi:heme exporter protein D